MRIVDASEVSARADQVQSEGACGSDDPHVIALAQVSRARPLYSNGRRLRRDFKNPGSIDPRGRVYSTQRSGGATTRSRTTSCSRAPIKRFVDFPLGEPQIEVALWRQVPRGTDLFGDHVSLVRVKSSAEFLGPLLDIPKISTPKRALYLLASTMRADEIHPEVREKLDRIAESLNPTESIP